MSRIAWLIRKLGFCVCVVACSTLLASGVRADDVADEADVEFSLGTLSYQAGEYQRALSHFLASNRLARNRNVLFNIARCYEQLKQFPEAHRYYVRAADGERDPSAVARTNEAIARIAPNVAILEIATEPGGARIFLDRKDLGERGTAPQRMALPASTYRVIAELEGWEDATSDAVALVVGREAKVSLRLRRIVGIVRVSGPKMASVRLDADNAPEFCTAPCDVEAAPGQHTVIIAKPGYRTQRIPVWVVAKTATSVETYLTPETGSLVVHSDERDARIEIDGVTQGFTPAILNVPVGLHRIRVSLHGFRPIVRDVLIRENERAQLDLTLVPMDSVEAASRTLELVEDAPASVSLVTSQELRGMRYPTLAEALRGTRGLYLSDDRGYQALGFRGFGRPGAYGNRVLVTLDGMPLNDDWIWASYVGSDLRTDLEDIDRIEVVRGPGSVVYGTSAFSGVVNLVTRGKEAPEGREVGVSATGDGVARARARITKRFGDRSGFWASIAGGQSEGRDFFFPEYVADSPPEVAGYARGADGARFATLSGRAWWRDVSLAWSLHHHDKHLPTGQFQTLLGDDRTHQADTRGFLEARFERQVGRYVSSLSRLHANIYAFRGYFARSAESGGVELNKYDSTWGGAEQRFVVTTSPRFNASLGGEVQGHPEARQGHSTESDSSYPDDVRKFVVAAVYTSLEARPIEALKLSAGGRLDYYSTFGSSFNPRLALIARPYVGGNLKLLMAKAFKAPSVYELYYTGVGQISSPDLRPENIYSVEVEWTHRLSRNVVTTAAAYSNYIPRPISLEPTPSTFDDAEILQFRNTTTPVGTLGGELEIRRDWNEGWMLSASYSFQRSAYLASRSLADLFRLRASPDYAEVPNAPNHLASLRGGIPILSRALLLMSRLSFEGPRYDRVDEPTPDEPQGRTEHALLWDFVFSGNETRFGLNYALGIYNAFDSRAPHPVSSEFRQRTVPITGRSLLATANLNF